MVNRVILLLFVIFGLSQFASAQNAHTRLIYQHSLKAETHDDFAQISNHRGRFVDNGWKSTQQGINDGSKLIIAFNDRLPATGTIEWKMYNYDPYHQCHTNKQHIAFLTSLEGGTYDVLYEDGSWVYWRTGLSYKRNNGVCSMKMDAGSKGLDTRTERHVLWDKTWNPRHTYRFKVVYNQYRISFYLNDEKLEDFDFPGQVRRFRYLYLGGDFNYESIVGPVYSDLKVYTTQTDMFFLDKTYSQGLAGLGRPKFGGHGITIGDVNGDGREDMYIGNCIQKECQRDILYIQQPDGTFRDETLERGVEDECCSHGVVFFDADNDGDLDLFNANTWEPNQLYINDGTGYFSEESIPRGIESTEPVDETQSAGTRGAVVFDVNNDGYMDIFAVNWGERNEMYINDGTGHFNREMRGAEGSVEDPEQIGTQGVTVSDIDGDGDFDIYISKRQKANELYINTNGQFTEDAAARGVAVGGRSEGATFADYDNDGDMDLFVANTRIPGDDIQLRAFIFENRGDGTFIDRTTELNITMEGFTPVLADVNNDGWLDFYRLRNNTYEPTSMSVLNLNNGQGNFVSAGYCGADVIGADSRGCVAHDFDGDGDADYYITNKHFDNILLSNETRLSNHFLKVDITGPKRDRGGIGSKVWVYPAGRLGDPNALLGYREVTSAYGYLSGPGLIQHFGLGTHSVCDLRVQLIDGTVLEERNVQADQTIEINNTPLPQWSLNKTGGDEQQGFIGQKLADPLTVRLLDETGTPVSGETVEFTLVSGTGASFTIENPVTGADGVASTQLILGPHVGQYTVQARVTGAGNAVDFTAHAIEPPVTVQPIGDGQFGVVSQVLSNPVGVRLLYSTGSALQGEGVTFETTTENGLIDGGNRVTRQTDSRGEAVVNWTMPSTTGPVQMTVSWRDTSVVLTANAGTAGAAELVRLGDDPASMTPNQSFGQSLGVSVRDGFGNPIADYPVEFSVVSGGGRIDGQTSTTRQTNTSGQAFVSWTAGPYLGPAQRLRARITTLSGQTDSVQWQVEGIDIDPNLSVFSAPDTVLANGTDTANIQVTLKKPDGTPAGAGMCVVIRTSGADNLFNQPDTLTDAQGRVYATLASTRAETKIIQATVKGLDLQLNPVAVTFKQPEQNQIPERLEIVSGNRQTGPAGKALPAPFVLRLLDQQDMPIAGQVIRFQVLSGGGRFNGQESVSQSTDQHGEVRQTLTLGPTAGDSCVVRVYPADHPQLEQTLVAHIIAGDPGLFMIVSGNDQQGTAGSVLTDPLVVQVTDVYGNGIGQYPVEFSVLSGGGNVNGQLSTTVFTDEQGLARVVYGLGSDGTQRVQAKTAFASVFFTATITAQERRIDFDNSQITVSDSTALPDGMDRVTIWVKIVDTLGDPVPGVTLQLSATGQGNQLVQPANPTDATGTTAGTLSSTVAGTKQITAQVMPEGRFLMQSVEVYFASVQTAFEKVSGDNQTGIAGQLLSDPFVVRVSVGGNPEVDHAVLYRVIAGDGHFAGNSDYLTRTDTHGKAGARLALAESADSVMVRVTAAGVEKELIFKARVTPDRELQLEKFAGDNQQVPYGQMPDPLMVRVTDENSVAVEGIAVRFTAIDQGTVVGSQPVPTSQDGLAECRVQVPAQAGEYHFNAHMPSSDQTVTFLVTVKRQNHPPEIVSYEPAQKRLQLQDGHQIEFHIQARDADNDPVHYVWSFNDVALSNESSLSLLVNPTLPNQFVIVGTAYDQYDSTHVEWTCSRLLTDIILSQFTSRYVEEEGVYLEWAVDDYASNRELRIYRQDMTTSGPLQQVFGTILSLNTPTFIWDRDVLPGRQYRYQIDILSSSGDCLDRGEAYVGIDLPALVDLKPCYPNPFNSTVRIHYTLPEPGFSRVTVYNSTGSRVKVLSQGYAASGTHRLEWNGRDDAGNAVPSGVFYIELFVSGQRQVRKVVLIK